jgi:ATP phosphoribosyltransferase
LKLNDLVSLTTVLQSQAALIAHPATLNDEYKTHIINRLMMRFRGVIAAQSYKYIMMNAPRAALAEITALAAGLHAPTVLPTTDPEWVSVHIAAPEDMFWDVIERLRALNARGILVSPIEKIFL